jgi:DNA topoisomerase-1
VSHEGVNATLPSDKTPETVTLEEATALIDARAERSAPTGRARPRAAKRPSLGTARHVKASSKRPTAPATKRPPAGKTPRKSTQAAE